MDRRVGCNTTTTNSIEMSELVATGAPTVPTAAAVKGMKKNGKSQGTVRRDNVRD